MTVTVPAPTDQRSRGESISGYRVFLQGIDIPFWDLVAFRLKLGLATFVAALLLSVLYIPLAAGVYLAVLAIVRRAP